MVTVLGGRVCLGNEAVGDARRACELWLISGHSPQKSTSFPGYYSSVFQADSRSLHSNSRDFIPAAWKNIVPRNG